MCPNSIVKDSIVFPIIRYNAISGEQKFIGIENNYGGFAFSHFYDQFWFVCDVGRKTKF